MATKSLYFKNAAPTGASTSLSLQDGGTAPTTGITTTGWTVAKLVAPNFSAMLAGTKRASTTFASTDALGSFAASASFRSEDALSGTFANTNWTLAFRIRAVTLVSAQTGQIRIRLWRSANADGTGATQITSAVQNGTTTAVLSTSASATSTVTWTPGATVTLNNEYLWAQCEWSITATSGANTSDAVFYIEASGVIITPNFVAAYNDTITPGGVPIGGASITPVFSGAAGETEVFAATLTTNDSGDGAYSMRSVFPVTGMADAAFLVLVVDYGATSSARTLPGLGTITGAPGVGATTAYQNPFDSYQLAHELPSVIPGTIYNVNSVKVRGTGAAREICARLEASSAAATNIDNVSIGIWNGTTSSASPYQGSTKFTPVELKWGGASGISMSAGTMSAYSDWMVFPDNIAGVYGGNILNNTNTGWQGYTLVTVLNAADLKPSSGSEVRIAIAFGAASAGQTTVAYIGQQATSGDPYDFKATPAQFTFGGIGTITHDGVQQLYFSDWITLPEAWDNTKNYCVAFQFSAGGTTDIRHTSATSTSGITYYKAIAAEAATVDKSGYSPLFSGNAVLTEILEARTAAGGINYTETITAGTLPIGGASITAIYTVKYTETITAGAVPIGGQNVAAVYAFADTITPSTVPLVGQAITPVYTARYSDTIAASAVPINGSTITAVYTVRYSDTIAASALPIGGATITPISSAGGINYTDFITPGSLPIVGQIITAIYSVKYSETIAPSPLLVVGRTITPVYTARYSDTLAPGALPIVGRIITPVFSSAFSRITQKYSVIARQTVPPHLIAQKGSKAIVARRSALPSRKAQA
jgi:hypothetical protein